MAAFFPTCAVNLILLLNDIWNKELLVIKLFKTLSQLICFIIVTQHFCLLSLNYFWRVSEQKTFPFIYSFYIVSSNQY